VEQNNPKAKGRWKLLLILAVCLAPVIASYLTYYVIKPTGRTNYGTLLDPRNYPMPHLGAFMQDGKSVELDAFKGKWIMLQVDDAACVVACRTKLLNMRQVRLMQGKEMDRIERVWLITDDATLDPILTREFDGTRLLRVKREAVAKWLPAENGGAVTDYIYIIDPLGNLMMRIPKDPDPYKMKKDMLKLLTASSIG